MQSKNLGGDENELAGDKPHDGLTVGRLSVSFQIPLGRIGNFISDLFSHEDNS